MVARSEQQVTSKLRSTFGNEFVHRTMSDGQHADGLARFVDLVKNAVDVRFRAVEQMAHGAQPLSFVWLPLERCKGDGSQAPCGQNFGWVRNSFSRSLQGNFRPGSRSGAPPYRHPCFALVAE